MSKPSGVIEPHVLYTVDEARERLRLGRTAWQGLVTAGLTVIRHGRGRFVFGDDILATIRGKQSAVPRGSESSRRVADVEAD